MEISEADLLKLLNCQCLNHEATDGCDRPQADPQTHDLCTACLLFRCAS